MLKIDDAALNKMFADNRDGWNQRAAVHKDSAFYDLEGFKAGKSSLNPMEVEALGDVQGKKLLHLQCHFGMDTLSWARKGAIVTGVDFSETAIASANGLASELEVEASFVCANVYDLPAVLDEQFDIVFTSYGVIGWLPDLDKWASVVSYFLKPGGTFFMAEFHPVIWMLDENFERVKYYYHNIETISEFSKGTYTDRHADIAYSEHSWNHSIGEVLNALITHGCSIASFDEFTYSYYNCFNNLVQGIDGLWRVKGLENKIPIMYGVKAVKQ